MLGSCFCDDYYRQSTVKRKISFRTHPIYNTQKPMRNLYSDYSG